MTPYTEEEMAAYSRRDINARQLIYFEARPIAGGEPVPFGFWTGTGDVSLQVIDAITGETVMREFTSRGAVLAVGDIAQGDDLNVRSVQVTLSQLNEDVENALRGHDLRNVPIQVYRAIFDPENPRALVKPARADFAGFINSAPITTPAVKGQASTVMDCVGCSRELTRENTDLRSDESQQRRYTGDRLFKWVAATGSVPIRWGQASQ